MKKKILYFHLLTISIIFSSLSLKGQITNYATIPYSTGFESGTLDANWYTTSDNTDGRIQIWNSTSLIWSGDTAKAHTDSLWLGLDVVNPGGTYVTNEAWFGLDLNNESNVRLGLWWSEWNDESEIEDGIFISDDGGTTFTKVIDLAGASYTDLQWNYFDINLDSVNSLYGLNFTSTYVIKLQQYDNYYFAGGNDGFLFDDISVYNTNPTSINETITSSASIYPNPTNKTINVKLNNYGTEVNYILTSIDGRIIKEKTKINLDRFSINLENESPGLYLLKVYDKHHSKTYKVNKL